MSSSQETPPLGEPDPVFLHSRSEALIIFLIWLATFAWTVPYCYFNGFGKIADSSELQLVLGFPSWVFWGIGMPWLIADLLTIWLCFFRMTDDDLEPTAEQLATSREAGLMKEPS